MKMKKTVSLLLALCLLSALLSGCGSASESAADHSIRTNSLMAPAAPEAMAENPLPENRKWVVTLRLEAETEDLDTTAAALNETIAAQGGYVEDQRLDYGSGGSRYRSADFTIRIPVQQVDAFLVSLGEVSNLLSQERQAEDVTLQYADTEGRIAALEAEEARLLELLAQAENMSDLLEIEARLTEVRYELESVASHKRLLDNKIDYATLYLQLTEVREYTPAEPTFWQRVQSGFAGSLEGLWAITQDLAYFLLAGSPYLIVLGGLTAVIILPIRSRKKKKGTKEETEKPEKGEEK